ncbi:MAG: thioredoxin domain-containing protein, partial [Streptosporangiaceae bacterium]
AVKVDREERPDVDDVYMTATQAMTGQGGWPMTVFMTPQKEPFRCGTYFPPDYFRQLILNVSKAWRTQRDGVDGQAKQVAAALAQNAAATARALREGSGAEFGEVADAAAAALGDAYDGERGGFGGAPKFPPSMVLEFLLRHHRRTGSPEALVMARGTCQAMARGGMYDQLAGGFARYSVDAGWVVPHFEKMLYDNALLARVYLNLWRATGSELARRVAGQTCSWLRSELLTPEGGFAASLDADSEGEEGRFYVWRPAELDAVLGREDGEFAARVFGVTGTFERGASVLQLRADPEDAKRFAEVRRALLAARDGRVRPGRDDKVVAAWNGLAISALAECGVLLGRPDLTAVALDAAALLAEVHLVDGRLIRTSRHGSAGDTAGILEDYACVAEGFLVLSGITGEGHWTALAGQLLDVALTEFGDGAGGFYDTAADGEPLIFRPADPADNATPSGAFAVSGALLRYATLTGSARHREAALAGLRVLPAIAARYPRAAGAGLAVAEAVLAGPVEIAIVGSAEDERTGELHRTALHAAPPGAVTAYGDGTGAQLALLEGRGLVEGAPAAYVCREFACQAPVTTPQQLRDALAVS